MATSDNPRMSDIGPLTGIVAAMEEEVSDLRARMVGARAVAVAGAHVTMGWIGAARVALAVTGDGERNARRGLSALLALPAGAAGSWWSASRAACPPTSTSERWSPPTA